ncbi:unnamed protein product, partial [Rotaria sp. Silwood2]
RPAEVAALLKIQGIRTVNIFLHISNIFNILNIDSEEINYIKTKTYFILKNDSYVVRPGSKASIEYLRDLFEKKQDEILKNTNSKRWSISNVSSTTITTPNSFFQTITSTNATIQHSMNEWCLKHADEIGISDLKLIEGTDYLFTLSSSFDDFAHIRCGCCVSARLLKQEKNFLLPNYYRHLKGKPCSMLKAKQEK